MSSQDGSDESRPALSSYANSSSQISDDVPNLTYGAAKHGVPAYLSEELVDRCFESEAVALATSMPHSNVENIFVSTDPLTHVESTHNNPGNLRRLPPAQPRSDADNCTDASYSMASPMALAPPLLDGWTIRRQQRPSHKTGLLGMDIS